MNFEIVGTIQTISIFISGGLLTLLLVHSLRKTKSNEYDTPIYLLAWFSFLGFALVLIISLIIIDDFD